MFYREAHILLEELADATLAGTRKDFFAELTTVPLLIIDNLGMRKLPHTAAEDLLKIIMRRYERASTLLTSNRPVDDWGKLLGDTAAVQDHRAIKRRVKAKPGFREFQAARRTIQGYEAMHMLRKGQARWVSGSDVRRQIQFINNLFGVAA